MTKLKLFLIIILAIVCITSAITISTKLIEKRNVTRYSQAIKFYKAEDYQNAYYNFGKVSDFSTLKAAALFRQARCADKIGDKESAIKNYFILIKRFPNSELFPISEYSLGTELFETSEYRLAKRHFQHIVKKYPDREIATASKFFLGLLNDDKDLLLEYIKEAPNGRYTERAACYLITRKTKLTNSEFLIVAKTLLIREQYEKAIFAYKNTTPETSWAGFAKAKFKTGDIQGAKQLIINGLKLYSANVDEDDIHDCIDYFVEQSQTKQETLKTLSQINKQAKGEDYILYLLAQSSPNTEALKIYKQIYTQFPNSKYSADAMYKVFYSKICQGKYDEATKLGKKHLSKYETANSAPAVMFWLAKTYEKRHMKDMAKNYYRGILSKYPDDYYALRANAKLNKNGLMFEKNTLSQKPVVFPIQNKAQANLAMKLAQVGDYDLVQELYPKDDFVQSWVEYQKGNYTNSVLIARDAMDKLNLKPNFKDVRWRLVYPVHYNHFIDKYSMNENPIIILSIIKEESHFNPKAKSCVGAGGLMQLMPTTANEIAKGYRISNNLYNPANNIHLGCLYYAQIKRSLNNKDMSAIMAYNGGFGAVQKWKSGINCDDIDDFVEKIPFPETQTYLKKVMRTYWNYTKIY